MSLPSSGYCALAAAAMICTKTNTSLSFIFFILLALTAFSPPGRAAEETATHHLLYEHSINNSIPSKTQSLIQGVNEARVLRWRNREQPRRSAIGSTAPTCTYNECRGCKFKCRAEQIPVDANDPINSAYHYRCVCHR